jgi:hypothetical protein
VERRGSERSERKREWGGVGVGVGEKRSGEVGRKGEKEEEEENKESFETEVA